jgi:hypothetical protein
MLWVRTFVLGKRSPHGLVHVPAESTFSGRSGGGGGSGIGPQRPFSGLDLSVLSSEGTKKPLFAVYGGPSGAKDARESA